jgi:hypothetical protein
MGKISASCLLLAIMLCLDVTGVSAIDVGWMQQGVRVWYFGAVGSVTSSDAEEAYLLGTVNGTDVQVTKHSASDHWVSPQPVNTSTYSFLDQGPFWIHPQVLQVMESGYNWQGHTVATVLRNPYTYDTFKAELSSEVFTFPYLLLPIRALFDLSAQRNLVKLVYYIDQFSTGIAYFDADTGLMLLYENSNGFVTVFFLLSEINYDFASHQAFAEDNGPHTGFKSSVLETQMMPYPDPRGGSLSIQSTVESRYGLTVQMWTTGTDNGTLLPNENYCFFGAIPILRHILMTQAPNYPPTQWTPYGQHLWWWVPPAALQNTSINVFDVPMTRTSTNPYTFTATQSSAGLFFPKLWFDNDGYMYQFAAKDASTGLDIDPEREAASSSPDIYSEQAPLYYVNQTTVVGLDYYRNTMGNAIPPGYTLALTVVSDTADKGGGTVSGDGNINCNGHGLSPSGMSGTCQAEFPSGATVNLSQDPDSDSVWGTWSVSGCGSNQGCQVLMSSDRNVTVTFPYSPMAKLNSSGYRCDSLLEAYGHALSTDIVFGRAVTFTENFTLGNGKAITLMGGRDAWYQPQNAWTTLQGNLSVQSGSLIVERLSIR